MSTRSSVRNLFPLLDNPEITIRRRSRADPTLLNDFEIAAEGNGDPPVPDLRTIEELFQPSLNGRGGPIAPIANQSTNFGLKNDMIQQVHNSFQFHGLSGDDANKHLDKFLHVTQSIKVNGVTDDALRLYLFPHSLTRNAINTFEQMAKMFLGKYFPPSMVTKLKNEIINYRERPDESLFEAWEHYNLSIDRCPNHNMLPVTQIDTFYNGLTLRHRDTINAAAATVGQTHNVYAAGAYQGGNSYQPQVERETEVTKGTVLPTNNGCTKGVQPPVVQTETRTLNSVPVVAPIIEPVVASLPEKLGDHGKFLTPCDFSGMDECLALTDLGARINLMPLSVWSKLSLPKLYPTRMTLKLADRSISGPVEVAEDVIVKVGTFHFPADFVVVDFDSDPRVSLILEISFLKTRRALIDVFEGELTLRVGKEAITFNLDQTSRYSTNYNDMTANRIDIIDMACEEYSQEVLGFSDVIASGNPTPYYDPIVSTSSTTLTLFGDSDFLLEEVEAFLALEDDATSPEVDQSYFDPEGDIFLLEAFLNDDPSLPLPIKEIIFLQFERNLNFVKLKLINLQLMSLPRLECRGKAALITVLKSHNQAIAWKLSDIKGNNPEFCTHKILMEDDFEPAVQYQRRVNPKIHDVIKNEVLKLLDDGLIYPISDSPWEKSNFMVKEGIVLGHKISKNGIEVDKAKVDVIAKLPHTTTVKGIRSFLGHAGFYRRFIQYFSKIAQSMTHLLEKDSPFLFSKECVESFQTLKKN
nr:reverse transcriptase domain-containing protein [Tanacetum cinerariifolium]